MDHSLNMSAKVLGKSGKQSVLVYYSPRGHSVAITDIKRHAEILITKSRRNWTAERVRYDNGLPSRHKIDIRTVAHSDGFGNWVVAAADAKVTIKSDFSQVDVLDRGTREGRALVGAGALNSGAGRFRGLVTNLTLSRARVLNGKILNKFGKYIPSKDMTGLAYDSFSQQGEQMFKRGELGRHPSLKKYPDFVNHTLAEEYRGKIYIDTNSGQTSVSRNFVHESIHYYSAPQFKKRIGNEGSSFGINFNEGVTEYFTREVVHRKVGVYERSYAFAQLIAHMVGESIMRRAYFGGDKGAIAKIKKALSSTLS